MAFKSKAAVLPPATVATGDVAAALEPVEYPPVTPPVAADENDLRSLLSSSDKELRISSAGIYQSLITSNPLYAAHNVMDRDTWHAAIEEEYEYFMRRVLERARKE